MIGLDTSFLVALGILEHPLHTASHTLLQKNLTTGGDLIALTPSVLAKYIHVVTDPRRFLHPFSVEETLADSRWWWTAIQTRQVLPTALFLDWMERHRLGRKRILDTQLATTLYAAGVRQLFTANPADFEVFGVFELPVP